MAHTNAWNEALPLGSSAPSTIDDRIRQLKLDIRERLDDFLATGKKFTNDPCGLIADGVTKIYGPFEIQPIDWIITNQAQYVTGVTGGWWETLVTDTFSSRGFPFPKGAVLTNMEVLHRNLTGATTMTYKLFKKAFSAGGAATLIATLASAVTGADTLLNMTINETVDDSVYWIENVPAGNKYRVYGYRFTMNIPVLAL